MEKPDTGVWSDEQVETYLSRDIWPQMKWYESESTRAERRLHIWTWIGILSGLTATILAAMPTRLIGEDPLRNDLLRYMIVIASAIATLASGLLG